MGPSYARKQSHVMGDATLVCSQLYVFHNLIKFHCYWKSANIADTVNLGLNVLITDVYMYLPSFKTSADIDSLSLLAPHSKVCPDSAIVAVTYVYETAVLGVGNVIAALDNVCSSFPPRLLKNTKFHLRSNRMPLGKGSFCSIVFNYNWFSLWHQRTYGSLFDTLSICRCSY